MKLEQENEDIESLIIKDKDSVIKSDILEVPDYSYWFSQESLDYKRLRNNPKLSTVATTWDYNDLINKPTLSLNTYIWQFSFTTTWNKVITWVWFIPKLVMFQVNIWSRSWCGQMTTTAQNSISYADWPSTSHCVYIRDWSGTLTWRGTYVSMDTDWFTVNIDTASWTTVYVNYTCFW